MTVPERRPPQTTRFRDRTPSARQLDGLLLIELAIREQANLDEGRRPLVPYQPTLAGFCAKSHQNIAGTMVACVSLPAAAVAARPALVR